MRAERETTPDVISAFALMALRAEMEALAAVLPGLWQDRRDPGRVPDQTVTEAATEADFDNMPV
ncbi:hypothetical protein [Paragemmobacter aquarius]|uniref:hypothetical protein n=1 Tax=Paragemmobacter aquarius TaxID=2169400 RepID=UPI00131EF939|nr:hypothetical protein [Gemmobacter aquarius]